MTMTKADIVEIIHQKIGFGRKESTEIVEHVFEIIQETLESGEKIKISGFGNFTYAPSVPARVGTPILVKR